MRPRIEARDPATHLFDVEIARFNVEPVEIGDLQFPARQWFEVACITDDVIVVEI